MCVATPSNLRAHWFPCLWTPESHGTVLFVRCHCFSVVLYWSSSVSLLISCHCATCIFFSVFTLGHIWKNTHISDFQYFLLVFGNCKWNKRKRSGLNNACRRAQKKTLAFLHISIVSWNFVKYNHSTMIAWKEKKLDTKLLRWPFLTDILLWMTSAIPL